MAITTAAKERTLDKLNNTLLPGGEVLIGESNFDGSGSGAAGFIADQSLSFTRTATVLSLNSTPVTVSVPSGATYTVDRAYFRDGFTDMVPVFQSLGLSALADTEFTVGGNFVINSFTINITEV